jgi:hypothetical protein
MINQLILGASKMMRITFRTIVGTVSMASLLVWSALAADGPDKTNRTRTQSLYRTAGTPAYQILNINNLWTWARRDGQSNHSPTGDDGMYFPRGTRWVIYQDGFMFGGKAMLDPNYLVPHPTQVVLTALGQTLLQPILPLTLSGSLESGATSSKCPKGS